MKKTMKWKLGVAFSLALFAGFAAFGVRPSWAVSTDVFNNDSRLYVPYWRSDASAFTILIVENVSGPGSVPAIRFYDKNCNFVKDDHPPLTTNEVDFIDVSSVLAPTTGEGGIVIDTTGKLMGSSGSSAKLTAESIVVNTVDGSILRVHHINTNGAGNWTTFENKWSGAFFNAGFPNNVDNELYLFCPGPFSTPPALPGQNKMATDLLSLANSPVGSASAFAKGTDIGFFDDKETLLVTQPLSCTCVTRVLLQALTSAVVGTNGRIEIIADGGEDLIAFMKRQVHGTPFQINGYMFSH